MMNHIRTTVMGMSILATALVSTTAMATPPQAQVISPNCNNTVNSTKHHIISSALPSRPNSKLPIAAPGSGPSEKKTCEDTFAPATNKQGVNGTNRCTTCTYSSSGHVTVNCIFIAPKNPGAR